MRVLVEGARSADPPINQGMFLAARVQYLGRGLASGQALRVGGEFGKVAVPPFRELAVLHSEQFFGEVWVLFAILIDLREPIVAQLLAPLSDTLTEVIVDAVWHVEFLIFWPAVASFGKPDLLLAQRLAVGPAGILFIGSAVSDMAVYDNQRRPVIGV